MSNFIEDIYDFNSKAGLLEKGYDDFLESSFQIEEALEGFTDIHVVAQALNREHFGVCKSDSPKDVARGIIMLAEAEQYDDDGEGTGETERLSDVERLDKAIDAIVFAVGSIAKLGLNVEQIHRAIGVVTAANLVKLDCPKDEFGKLTKPADFVGPEVELQRILDERQ